MASELSQFCFRACFARRWLEGFSRAFWIGAEAPNESTELLISVHFLFRKLNDSYLINLGVAMLPGYSDPYHKRYKQRFLRFLTFFAFAFVCVVYVPHEVNFSRFQKYDTRWNRLFSESLLHLERCKSFTDILAPRHCLLNQLFTSNAHIGFSADYFSCLTKISWADRDVMHWWKSLSSCV